MMRTIALLALLALAACNAPSSQPTAPSVQAVPDLPAFGGRLVEAMSADASTLIPMLAGDAPSHAIADWLYRPLLKYDRNLNLTGDLATRWEVQDGGRTIVFHLRKDAHWTDGVPFTSKDVAFTLKLIRDPHTQSPYASDFASVSSWETPDPYTFIVHYREPFAPALSAWAGLAILPAHIFAGEDIMHTPLARHPKATIGPYRLVAWNPQQEIRLVANRGYYDGPVWIAERIVRVIPDPTTQFMELEAGRLDMMGLTPVQYARIFPRKPELARRFRRFRYLDFGYTYLGFNLDRPLFRDVRVRRAIAMAINRKEIIDVVLFGLGEIIATPYKPGTYWENRKIKPWPYDPVRAKKLLAQAGWRDRDGDGVLEDAQGRKFAFTILTNNGNRQREKAAVIIQRRLGALGMRVKVRLVEWSSFIAHFVDKRRFDAVILGWALSPEPDQYAIWHSSQIGPHKFNFLGYRNARVDRALEAARRTFDRAQRKALYDLVQEEIHKDVPMVFLYAPYSLPVVHRRVHGIEPAPAGISWNAEHWYIPKPLQRAAIAP